MSFCKGHCARPLLGRASRLSIFVSIGASHGASRRSGGGRGQGVAEPTRSRFLPLPDMRNRSNAKHPNARREVRLQRGRKGPASGSPLSLSPWQKDTWACIEWSVMMSGGFRQRRGRFPGTSQVAAAERRYPRLRTSRAKRMSITLDPECCQKSPIAAIEPQEGVPMFERQPSPPQRGCDQEMYLPRPLANIAAVLKPFWDEYANRRAIGMDPDEAVDKSLTLLLPTDQVVEVLAMLRGSSTRAVDPRLFRGARVEVGPH